MSIAINPNPSAKTAALALVPLGVLLNLGIGTIVHLLKLPIFLDATGTMLVTVLIGWRWGLVSGVLSFLIGGLLVNPVMPWFSGTQAVIAMATGFMAVRGGFKKEKTFDRQRIIPTIAVHVSRDFARFRASIRNIEVKYCALGADETCAKAGKCGRQRKRVLAKRKDVDKRRFGVRHYNDNKHFLCLSQAPIESPSL